MTKSLIGSLLLLATSLPATAQTAAPAPDAGIQAFNHKLEDATRRMDNAATLALWTEDGISLLPSTKPIVGKPAIAAFLENVTASIQGATMQKFEMSCFAVDVSGNLATEWCTEHQVVQLPGGKPPFDGHGKMLLVLRKGSDGNWRMEREMWNEAAAE
jgi:uncharacterized protein (TIGR02246 family)